MRTLCYIYKLYVTFSLLPLYDMPSEASRRLTRVILLSSDVCTACKCSFRNIEVF